MQNHIDRIIDLQHKSLLIRFNKLDIISLTDFDISNLLCITQFKLLNL